MKRFEDMQEGTTDWFDYLNKNKFSVEKDSCNGCLLFALIFLFCITCPILLIF